MGNTSNIQNRTSNPVIYGFTGREFDLESKTYFYRNRQYNPDSGKFLSQDPIGFAGGDVNLSSYVRNKSLSQFDPYGLTEQDVRDAINYVVRQTNYKSVSFAFGTPKRASGFAIPFLSHIQVDSKYKEELDYDQMRALLQTVYHEMTHVEDGTYQTLTNSKERHNEIHKESFEFSLKHWKSFAGHKFKKTVKRGKSSLCK